MGSVVDGQRGERVELVVASAEGRADAVLAESLPALSRSRLQKLIAEGRATVDGVALRKASVVHAGQEIAVAIPDDGPAAGSPPAAGLRVIYEDDDLVAVDKPAGIIVHPAPGDDAPAVSGWFAQRYPEAMAAFEPERPGVVHRLDRDTSGVLVLAKTAEAHAHLSTAFESRDVDKVYIAICDGIPDRGHAIIDAPIGRSPGDRGRMAVLRDGNGKAARTEYELLGSHEGRSLLVVKPESGRTHQVRVHLAAIGIPVTFDTTYGTPGEGRHQLHASRLTLPHPAGGTLTLPSPLPPDMAARVRAMGLSTVASEYLVAATATRSSEDQ